MDEAWANSIMTILPYASRILETPNFADAAMRAAIQANRFLQYHTAASSLGSLYTLALQCINVPFGRTVAGPNGLVFGPTEAAALTAVVGAPYDATLLSQVHLVTIAKIYHILDLSDRLPRNWWMGKRAAPSLPDGKVKMLKAYLKKQTELASTAMDEAETPSDLSDTLSSMFTAF